MVLVSKIYFTSFKIRNNVKRFVDKKCSLHVFLEKASDIRKTAGRFSWFSAYNNSLYIYLYFVRKLSRYVHAIYVKTPCINKTPNAPR